MKKLIILFLLLSNQYIKAQFNFDVDLGIGLTTPIMKNQNNGTQNNRVLSPLIGMYPQVSYKNFVLNTGIEYLTLKNKLSNSYEHEDYIRNSQQENTLSKVNIPLTLGYRFSISRVSFMPYFGGIYNVNINYKTKYSSVNTIKESNKRYAVEEGYEDYYDGFYDVKKLQWITGLEIGLNRKLSLDVAYLFSKGYGTYYYRNIDCFFCCLIAPHRKIISGKEARLSLKYAL